VQDPIDKQPGSKGDGCEQQQSNDREDRIHGGAASFRLGGP
jgi:hypothetical protein